MGKINLFIDETNEVLAKKELVLAAVKVAEEYSFAKLKIDWNIDVLIRSAKQKFLNAKDYVCGHTYDDNLIRLIVEDGFSDFEISEVLVHELCHAARWGKNNEWTDTLFDALIFEGLAVCFAEDFSRDNAKRQFYMETIVNRTDKENKEIFSKLSGHLRDTDYNYERIFNGNNDGLPRWAGYSLGYYLVKKYLKKSGKTVEEAFADKYAEVEVALQKGYC